MSLHRIPNTTTPINNVITTVTLELLYAHFAKEQNFTGVYSVDL